MSKRKQDERLELLDDRSTAVLNDVVAGRWVIFDDSEICLDIFECKKEIISHLTKVHNDRSKRPLVKRITPGEYQYFYHDEKNFSNMIAIKMIRIDSTNLSDIREKMLCALLPAWYYNPLSEKYIAYHRKRASSRNDD